MCTIPATALTLRAAEQSSEEHRSADSSVPAGQSMKPSQRELRYTHVWEPLHLTCAWVGGWVGTRRRRWNKDRAEKGRKIRWNKAKKVLGISAIGVFMMIKRHTERSCCCPAHGRVLPAGQMQNSGCSVSPSMGGIMIGRKKAVRRHRHELCTPYRTSSFPVITSCESHA